MGVPLALANHGVLVEGNPTCESVGFGGSTEVKSDPAGSTETIGPVTFTYPSSQTVDITIAEGFAIDAVIVKAADAYLYTTPPFSGLQAPLNNGGQLPAISHVSVCYSTAETTTTTVPTTNTTVDTTTTTVADTTTTTKADTTTTSSTVIDSTTTTVADTTTTTKADTTTTTKADTTTTTKADTTTTSSTVIDTTSTTVADTTTTTKADPTTTTVADTTPTTKADTTSTTEDDTQVKGIEIAQTELPQTGLGDSWTAAVGAFLIVIGSLVLMVSERQGRSRRTALLRRL